MASVYGQSGIVVDFNNRNQIHVYFRKPPIFQYMSDRLLRAYDFWNIKTIPDCHCKFFVGTRPFFGVFLCRP